MVFLIDNVLAAEIPIYELDVIITPKNHSIRGKARIIIPQGVRIDLDTGPLNITAFSSDGLTQESPGKISGEIEAFNERKIIEIDYEAKFRPPAEEGQGESFAERTVIDVDEIMLMSDWYPSVKGFCIYKLTVQVPKGIEVISESDSVSISQDVSFKTFQFYFPHPTPGITLIGGPYNIHEERFHDILIKTYLFSKDSELTKTYMEHTKDYIEFYESMLDRFPYKTFSIVENRHQTGYSFPTYTLLGSQVLRLPFIVKTSLGHELLHQWFGNYVYVDHANGNWSEGLTTYLSDHWYEYLKGKGVEDRKKIMIDFMNYVDSEGEIPLSEFVRGQDLSSKAIGYGKSAMIFHMLRRRLGDKLFFEGLREIISSLKYRMSSWHDIRDSFADVSDEELGTFFEQWVTRKGLPSLRIGKAHALFREGEYVLSVDIIQVGDRYLVDVPVKVQTDGGYDEFVIQIEREKTHYEKAFSDKPLTIFIDAEYDLMRRLTEEEKPPVVSAITGDKKLIVVVSELHEDKYRDSIDYLGEEGYNVSTERKITQEELKNHSLLILSKDNRIYRQFFAQRELPEGGLVVKIYKNPLNPSKVVGVFQTRNREELNMAFRKVSRYGNYSLLIFDNGQNVEKAIDRSENGIIRDLSFNVNAVEIESILDLDDIVARIRDKRVIYIGEAHTEYSHHLIQYDIMRKLHSYTHQLIIGMEMFQRPFQEYLDQYIEGNLTESEFLKKTEYFDRWAFDYNFYRDIMHFARANQIPVIALNLKREIIRKVSREGIFSLNEEEYDVIPQDIDMSDQRYRSHLIEVLSMHANSNQRAFENFFQSQLLWDETMALTIANTLRDFPDHQMIVLAGNGHLQYSWGIPNRVKRLTKESHAIVLNGPGDTVDKSLAHFVLFPPHLKPPESPKLQVLLKREERGLTVKKVMKGGPAERAGLEEGDIISTIDGQAIDDVVDIKLILLSRRAGDSIQVTIQRRQFIFGFKEMTVDVML
jgi:uncharacterized iron-regulated protein